MRNGCVVSYQNLMALVACSPLRIIGLWFSQFVVYYYVVFGIQLSGEMRRGGHWLA